MKEVKRVILVGHAASGKTHLAEDLIKTGYQFPLTYTTRPARNGEIDGVHYHFISEDEFKTKISNDEMYEYVVFNEWYYGRTKEDFYAGNLLIMTPAGVSQMTEEDRKSSFIIYLNIDENIRKERLSERNDADSTERRLKADYEDFKDFLDFNYVISNPNFISSNIFMLIERVGVFPMKQTHNKLV
jgi:guanylate kinase